MKKIEQFFFIPRLGLRRCLLFSLFLLVLLCFYNAAINPFIAYAVCSVLLILAILRSHPWDPLSVFMVVWGFVLLNVFCGFSSFVIVGNFAVPMFLIISFFYLFIFGYSCAVPCEKINVDNLIYRFLAIKDSPRNIKIGTIASWCSIGAFVCVFFDITFIRRLSLLDTASLRASILSLESVSIFASLGSLLAAGGIMAGLCFFCISEKNFICFVGLSCYALLSFLTAGRQNFLQLLLVMIFIFSFKRRYRIKIYFPLYLKVLGVLFCICILVYLNFLTQTRDSHRTFWPALEVLANDNNMTYHESFQNLLDNIPQNYADLMANGFIYFATQIPAFCERLNLEKFPMINVRYCRFFTPFLSRQFDKIFPSEDSFYERTKANRRNEHGGYISGTSWKTSCMRCCNLWGIVVFLFSLSFMDMYQKRYLFMY